MQEGKEMHIIYKFNHDAFVISARDMDRKERKRYAKT
jgi:uncharacterized DUF497 family protein